MIQVESLYKSYGTFPAVKNVSFEVPSGVIVGLLGPNGAGKTTIMKALTGYHKPTAGTILIDGKNVEEDPIAIKSMTGYLPEGVPLYSEMTVYEYLEFIAEARGVIEHKKETIENTMRKCGLIGFGDVLIDHLSKGYKQRVGLAQAILHNPAILILDEPTTGLDPNQILEIRDLIRDLGKDKTVILSTHILQEVEALCSKIIIINEGEIVADGSPEEIADAMKGEENIICKIKTSSIDKFKVDFANYLKYSPKKLVENLFQSELVVPAQSGDAAAESIFKWIVEHDSILLEMRRDTLSLEDIFVKLTREGGNHA
ncbi:MAG TPA: ATP-binding cassette domain-containing protein [Spirochaetia bacterium]|nr:ATP-binding cassette domain-containing protein [Spirochaetales bacterium]HRS65762.1 ATP-binding cassette domain-containing protein [Spirochaetia bacterium]HOT59580.1 ATP-binding cassette domain-containing protein [Spirochaetales bacterium]HQG40393.1 ATP-binding cassette domain-containing protein [Spirochaetales bacterium]HQK34970.1 ATP-binding cassette domain-containing protein [Spirochaetales bacterium]